MELNLEKYDFKVQRANSLVSRSSIGGSRLTQKSIKPHRMYTILRMLRKYRCSLEG